MSADLYLYALPDRSDLDALLDRYNRIEIIGDSGAGNESEQALRDSGALVTFDEYDTLRAALFGDNSHGLWIGQVSWLKSGLYDDEPHRYVPLVVDRVSALTEDAPVLTLGLAKAITVAFNLPRISHYEQTTYRRIERNYGFRTRRRAGYPGINRDRAEWDGKHSHTQTVMHRGDGFVIVREKGRGVNSGAVAKRWLERHVGQRIIAESE